jgi:serine/threonine protein kinase
MYAAPEVFNREIGSYDISVDVWSIGVILFTMCALSTFLAERI